MNRIFAISSLVALSLFTTFVGQASAHAIGVECKLVDAEIKIEAYFDDDTPARQAKVTIRNEAKEVVKTGRTDKKGVLTIPRIPAGKYEVTVDAGSGHLATVTMNVPVWTGKETNETTKVDATAHDGKENDGSGTSISTGQTRAEFTETPWLKMMIGLIAIGVITLAICINLHLKKTHVKSQDPVD